MENRLLVEEKEKDSFKSQLSELQTEFENYKIRVTSAFKKQKTEATVQPNQDPDNFNTNQVEREMLQRLVDALKLKISELE